MFTLINFINKAKEKNLNIHAVMVMQNDTILAKHHFTEPAARNVYSIAKSHTVTAIGMAIDEGKMHLTDKPVEVLADVIEDMNPEDIDPRWKNVTLYHLLTMTSGHGRPFMMVSDRKKLRGQEEKPCGETKKLRGESEKRLPQAMMDEWLRFAFTRPMMYEPGEKFCYGNLAPYVAGRMLEKAVGMTICDYLYEKFWKHTGMEKPRWENDNSGHTFTASDLYLQIDEMARLGQLYVGGGVYNGKRYLSEEWVKLASARHVDSSYINPIGSAVDEEVGYGLYFWRNSGEGYRCYGKKGQFIIMLPERNAVIAVQAEHDDVQAILDTIWAEILPQL